MFDAHNHPKPHGEIKSMLTTRMHKKQHMPHASSSKSLSPFSACLQPKAAWIRCSLYSYRRDVRFGILWAHIHSSCGCGVSSFVCKPELTRKCLFFSWRRRTGKGTSGSVSGGQNETTCRCPKHAMMGIFRREDSRVGAGRKHLHPQRERRLLTGPRSCGRRAGTSSTCCGADVVKRARS